MWDRIRRNYRRLVASMLIVVMVATNMGGNVSTVFAAGESESALFLVDGGELLRAIREAEEQGEVFKFSSLQLAASRKSIKNKYEKLLGTKEGKVYELDLDIDSSYAPEGTAVQVFYNAGTKDVVFLFQNESEMVVDYRVNIDGYEIEEVTVNPNTNNIEDEDASFAENYEAADMINDVKEHPKAEIVDSKETAASDEDAAKEDTDTAESTGTSEEGTEASGKDSETDSSDEETSEADTDESDAEEGEKETEAESDNAEEPETEAESEEKAELEDEPENEAEPEEENADSADGELLSLSRHEAVVVAISLDDLGEDGDSVLTGENEEGTEEDSEETEEETEAETEEETESETTEESDSETEAGGASETEETKESETKTEDGDIKEETGGAEEGNKAGETETSESKEEDAGAESGSSVAGGEDSEDIITDNTDGADRDREEEAGDGNDRNSDKIEMEGQALEDDEIEFLGKLEAKSLDTVTILDNINAKAVKVAWEDIEAIIAEDAATVDCLVEYSVNLPDGASVKGADSVAQGENLYFTVEVAENYELLAVYADGQELEALEEEVSQASAAEWKAGSAVYLVEGVEGDLSVEVEVEEVRPVIPAATYTAETDDAVFTVNVPEDAFEEEVEFRASKITDEAVLEELASQADEAVGESRTVTGILVYDLAFFTASNVEVEPGKPVNVSMSFKEEAVAQEMSEDASGISVVHFPEGEEAKTVTAVEETSVEELKFEAESFSRWAAVATREANISHDGWIRAGSLKELHAAFWPSMDTTKKIRIYLDSDIETKYDSTLPYEEGDHGWKIPGGADVVIDLNGHTLTYGGVGTENRRLFNVQGTLTIMDSSNGKGVINHNQDIDASILVTGNGTFNLEGGTITAGDGHKNKYGIEVNSSDWNSKAVFNMMGGSIEGNGEAGVDGAGILLIKGIATINGGSIKGNKRGIEINDYSAIFNMTGGSIESNGNAEVDGGGIHLVKGTVNISGGSIKENTAKNGGGISTHRSPVNINGGSIEGNTAKENGGGINIGTEYVGSLTVSGGEIKGNIAEGNGGGIYTHAGSATVINDGAKICNNKSDKEEPSAKEDPAGYDAGSGGGGIFSNGKLTIAGGEISGNEARADGGGVYVDKNWKESGEASFLMTEGVVSHNKAKNGEGGGLYFGWHGTVEGGSIFDNTTETQFDWGGGGIFIQTGVNVKMRNALITDNHADGFGGGVAGCPSGVVKIFTIDGAAIYDNSADGTGITNRTDEDRKTQDREAREEWDKIGYQDYQDYYCQNESVVYGKMLGGGSANWKGSSNQKISDTAHTETKMLTIGRYENASATYRMALSANPDETGKAYAESSARVRIYGNSSTTHGGGIMSNGHLELGEEGPGHLEISKTVIGSKEVQEGKEWHFTLSLSDPEGNPFSVDSGDAGEMDGGMQQGSIGFVIKDEATGEMEPGSLALENGQGTFALKHNQRIIFDDLLEGTVYHVEEVEANEDGFATQVKGSADSIAIEDVADATKVIGAEGHIPAQGETAAIDFYNMELGELAVSKTVVGETDEEDWTFVLTLMDADGNRLNGLPKILDPADGSTQTDALAFELSEPNENGDVTVIAKGSVPVNESGEVIFVLRHGQTITFKGIPVGTLYQVVEQDANQGTIVTRVDGSEGSVEIRDEKDPEKLIGSQGTIVTGQTASARFVNARLGTLAVSKTVVGDKEAESQDWEFELTLLQDSAQDPSQKEPLQVFAGTGGDPDGEMQFGVLPYEITGNGMAPEEGSFALDENGKAQFFLKHGQTITVKDIPAGTTYAVSEVKANQEEFITNVIGKGDASYVADEENEGKIKGTTGVILGDQVTTASFINTKSNVLTVSKMVKGDESFHDYEWRFTLKLFDKDGNSYQGTEKDSEDVDGEMQVFSIAYTGGSLIAGVEAPQDGAIALEGGEAQFVLKHGQFITLMDLPVGTKYTITEDEANAKGFYANVSGREDSVAVTDEENNNRVTGLSGTIESGKPESADFTNQKGRLTVRKIVRGNMADMTKEFPFTVTLDDKVINGRYGDMDFADGIATFKLKDGDSKEATDLPVGVGYSVKESDNADYHVEFSNASGTITADGVTVTCINTKNGDDTPGGDNPGGGGSGGNSGGGNSSGGNSPTTDIGDREVPLANFSDAPMEVIVESDVPLVPLPKTGDSRHKGMLLMLFGMAGFGAIFAAASLKKNKEED